jgi:hypothetical protein
MRRSTPKIVYGGLVLAAALALAGCNSAGPTAKTLKPGAGASAGAHAAGGKGASVAATAPQFAPASAAGTQSAVPWPSGTLTGQPTATATPLPVSAAGAVNVGQIVAHYAVNYFLVT